MIVKVNFLFLNLRCFYIHYLISLVLKEVMPLTGNLLKELEKIEAQPEHEEAAEPQQDPMDAQESTDDPLEASSGEFKNKHKLWLQKQTCF